MFALWKKSYDKSRQHIIKQRHHFADKGLYSQSYGISSSRVWKVLDNKEGWVLKNWCFQIVMLEKTLESPLDCKDIKPVNSIENQPWVIRDWKVWSIRHWKVLMLKLEYVGHLMRRANSLEKTLILGKIEGKRRTGQQRMRWLDSIIDSMNMILTKLWETV